MKPMGVIGCMTPRDENNTNVHGQTTNPRSTDRNRLIRIARTEVEHAHGAGHYGLSVRQEVVLGRREHFEATRMCFSAQILLIALIQGQRIGWTLLNLAAPTQARHW